MLELFANNQIDLLLVHGMPPAIKCGASGELTPFALYMFIWNALDFVAGALPITRVMSNEQCYESKHDDKFTR